MRTTLLPLLLAVPITLSAQNFPFPDSAALWVQSFSQMVTPPPFPQFEVQAVANIQVNGADTLINATSYSQLTDVLDGTYYGAVRDDGGRVWHVPVDSVQEYLLYDFTAEAGDTLTVIVYPGFPGNWAEPMFASLVVSEVYPDAEHENRRTLSFQGGGARWFEGIGCEYGLLAEPWINVSNYFVMLECMSHLDTIRHGYPAGTLGTCSPLVMGAGADPVATQQRAAPNPTSDRITLPFAATDATLWDVQGRQRQAVVHLRENTTDLDLGALPDGLYLLRTRQGGVVRTERIVKAAGAER